MTGPSKWVRCPECHQVAGQPMTNAPKNIAYFECQDCGHVWTAVVVKV